MADLLRYKDLQDAQTRAAVAALTEEAEALGLDPGSVVTVVHQQQKYLVRSPTTLPVLLDLLERQGLAPAVAVLNGLLLND